MIVPRTAPDLDLFVLYFIDRAWSHAAPGLVIALLMDKISICGSDMESRVNTQPQKRWRDNGIWLDKTANDINLTEMISSSKSTFMHIE